MDYNEWVQAVSILTSRASAANGYSLPTDFSNILPRAIEYGEDRIYKEMTFLGTRAQDASLTFSGSTRSLNLQNMTTKIIVPEGVAAITPVGTVPALGTRVQFQAASLDVIDMFWPDERVTAAPDDVDERYWAMLDAYTIVVEPTPDDTYVAEITGLFMPTALSSTNTTTYITLTYPALFVACTMIFLSGYLRNFGAQADNPKMSASWEDQYKILAASTVMEEQRRRSQGIGWSANAPAPLAKPDRT